jgi:multidrug resistance protein MdtO
VNSLALGSPGLGTFLRQELLSSPHRWRASIRLSVTATVALVLVMATHLPQGDYLIVILFLVGQNDLWGSPRRARLRLISLALGSLFVVWTLGAFVDKPWIRFPLQSLVLGGCIFLSRTTTAPFAMTMFSTAFLLSVPEYIGPPEAALEQALWRLTMVAGAVLVGTLVQLWIWRERPQDLLRLDLARRLRHAGQALDELAAPPDRRSEQAGLVAVTGLTGQLDLLDAAEEETPWLRARHAEQLKLITDAQVVVRGVLRLREELAGASGTAPITRAESGRLAAIRAALHAAADALEHRSSGTDVPLPGPPPAASSSDRLGVRLALREIEQGLTGMVPLLQSLDVPRPEGNQPESDKTVQPFLTPAFRLDDPFELRIALKGALSIGVCGLLYEGLSWPGLAACVFATLVLAQGSAGASIERALVQILFVLVGAGWAVLVVTVAMPLMTSLASLLVLTFPFFFGVAWICCGRGVSNTAGLQMAMGGTLVLLSRLGTTTDLVPARDRVLGILLGNVVFALISLSLWPVYAGSGDRIAPILRQIAALLRSPAAGDEQARQGQAMEIYRAVAREMSLQDEVRFEALSPRRQSAALLRAMLEVLAKLQAVLVATLELRRLDLGATATLSPAVKAALGDVERAGASRLENLGRLLQAESTPPLSLTPEAALHTLEERVTQLLPAPANPEHPWAGQAAVLLSTRLVTALQELGASLDQAAEIRGRTRIPAPPPPRSIRTMSSSNPGAFSCRRSG